MPGLFLPQNELILVEETLVKETKQQIIGEFEPILETLLEDLHIQEREHLMDLARSGKRVQNLTDWEKRRLRSEKKFIEYLEFIKPIWLKEKFFGQELCQDIEE